VVVRRLGQDGDPGGKERPERGVAEESTRGVSAADSGGRQ
jgi:hypothetical protein